MFKHLVLSALAALSVSAFVSKAEAYRYSQPKWNGYALDWCRDFEQGCGKPAADLFCRKHGATHAMNFQQWPNVNFATMTIGQSAICNPSVHRCDAFYFIDCDDTEIRTFAYPTYNGYRLDWCSQFEQGCGGSAANLFCQRVGYTQSVGWEQDPHLPVATMTIGSSAVCNPAYHVCDGFRKISCRR